MIARLHRCQRSPAPDSRLPLCRGFFAGALSVYGNRHAGAARLLAVRRYSKPVGRRRYHTHYRCRHLPVTQPRQETKRLTRIRQALSRCRQRHAKIMTELRSEVTTDPRVDPALAVKEPLVIRHRENTVVPDTRMDIKTSCRHTKKQSPAQFAARSSR